MNERVGHLLYIWHGVLKFKEDRYPSPGNWKDIGELYGNLRIVGAS